MAGRGPDERGRKPAGSGGMMPPSGPGSTVPRREIAAGGAPRGGRADHKACAAPQAHIKWRKLRTLVCAARNCWLRLSALRSLMFRGTWDVKGHGNTGAPISGLPEIGKFGFPDRLKPIWVRRRKNTGRGALLICCLEIESEKKRNVSRELTSPSSLRGGWRARRSAKARRRGEPGGGRCYARDDSDPHPARLRCAQAGDPPRKGEGKQERGRDKKIPVL
jgi:hypothetical protein